MGAEQREFSSSTDQVQVRFALSLRTDPLDGQPNRRPKAARRQQQVHGRALGETAGAASVCDWRRDGSEMTQRPTIGHREGDNEPSRQARCHEQSAGRRRASCGRRASCERQATRELWQSISSCRSCVLH